ncbi:ketopantoate reductase family protein [Algibacillus agarilyticus]|uniref:ketopantoate reductase family protein n=1 Tax=Algibacillus agarilyticus TaxID=2234133 RepID=UPI000DCFCD80|nr:2-dehydropantoate 2-reductase [Algibacillus agarilyticus]
MAKNYTVVGQGAIGSLIAYQLYQSQLGFNVVLKQKNQHRKPNIFIDFAKNETDFYTQLLPDDELITTLFLPLKAYDIVSAFKQVSHRLSPNACIILLNNGMGVAGAIKPFLKPKQTLLLASVTHGVLIQDNKIIHTGLGNIYLGFADTTTKIQPSTIKSLIKQIATIEWQNDIAKSLWLKLAINACINPITAINQQRNKSVLQPAYSVLIRDLCQEISQIAATQYIKLSAQELVEAVKKVAHATGDNYSSMRQDIANNRKTEVEYINGYLVKIAQKEQIELVNNQRLYEQVKALERKQTITY